MRWSDRIILLIVAAIIGGCTAWAATVATVRAVDTYQQRWCDLQETCDE